MAVITLTGPSCGGKTTLETQLKDRVRFGAARSTTTRAARPGEVNGQHYFFVDTYTFEEMEGHGLMVETVKIGPYSYGMSRAELNACAKAGHVVIVVDPHGAEQIRAHCEDNGIPAASVFVDVDPRLQMRRFYARSIVELDKVGSTEVGSVIARQLEKAQLMHTIEKKWILDAHTGGVIERNFTYDMIVPRFDDISQDQVVLNVYEMADGLTRVKALGYDPTDSKPSGSLRRVDFSVGRPDLMPGAHVHAVSAGDAVRAN